MSSVPSDWRTWLPYGDSFRFVDEIRSLKLPDLVVTEADFSRHVALIDAHRAAGEPVVPGALLAEQVAQSAWLLGRLTGWLAPGARVLLGRITCTFEQVAPVDKPVVAEVHGSIIAADAAGFRATLHSADKPIGRVVLAVRKLDG